MHGIKTLRWAAHRSDANAYGKYFDDGQVKVTWRTGDNTRDEDIAGTDLLAKFGSSFPHVGHNAKCTKLCCTTDSKELSPFTHVSKVCFDAEPKAIDVFPHVRTIEVVKP